MSNQTPDPQGIDSEYAANRTEAIVREISDKDKFNWQQHHDYYVEKYNEYVSLGKKLEEIEMKQYELAMLRERQGFVEPLS